MSDTGIIVITLAIFFLIIIPATVIVGKKRNWSMVEMFLMVILGILFFPIWLIAIIVVGLSDPPARRTHHNSPKHSPKHKSPKK